MPKRVRAKTVHGWVCSDEDNAEVLDYIKEEGLDRAVMQSYKEAKKECSAVRRVTAKIQVSDYKAKKRRKK